MLRAHCVSGIIWYSRLVLANLSHLINLFDIYHGSTLVIGCFLEITSNGLNSYSDCHKNRALVLISSYVIPKFYSKNVKILLFLSYLSFFPIISLPQICHNVDNGIKYSLPSGSLPSDEGGRISPTFFSTTAE